MALQWLPCQAPGVIGSVLGLVDPVSVYCDWVRCKVGSATSISVWQHVKLSEQIRPWDTLACCWDVKQATTNKLWFACLCYTAYLPLIASAFFPWSIHFHSKGHLPLFHGASASVWQYIYLVFPHPQTSLSYRTTLLSTTSFVCQMQIPLTPNRKSSSTHQSNRVGAGQQSRRFLWSEVKVVHQILLHGRYILLQVWHADWKRNQQRESLSTHSSEATQHICKDVFLWENIYFFTLRQACMYIHVCNCMFVG